MKNYRFALTFLLSLSAVIVATGCASYKMAAPATITDACDAYPIDRPKVKSSIGTQEWKMGPFTAKEVDLGGTKTSSKGVGGFSKSDSSTGMTFKMVSEGGVELDGKCEAKESSKGVVGFSSTSRTMECSFTSGEEEVTLSIGPDSAQEGTMGTLALVDGDVQVTETKAKDTGGSSSSATGYIFTREGTDLGAVDVVNSGTAYLPLEMDDKVRTTLAAAGVAMIFYAD